MRSQIKAIVKCLFNLVCFLTWTLGFFMMGLPLQADVVSTAVYEESFKGSINGLNLLYLKGAQSQRGFAHGYLLAGEIVRLINQLTSAVNYADSREWDMILELVQEPATFQFPQRFEDELENLFEGLKAALPSDSERFIHALGRTVGIDDLKAMHCIADARCSQFAVWGNLTSDGEVLIGRNLDYEPLIPPDLFYVIATDPIEEGRLATIDILSAGTIGLGNAALNEKGVYFAVNNGGEESQLKTGAVPEPLILRDLLECALASPDTISSIAAGLLSEKTTLARILHVAMPVSASRPHAFEWNPNVTPPRVNVRAPSEYPIAGGQALVMTNHFIKSDTNYTSASAERYEKIVGTIETAHADSEVFDFNKAKAILDLVDVSDENNTTLISAIIQPNSRKMFVAIYPRSGESALNSAFIQFSWDDIFNAGLTAADDDNSGHSTGGGGCMISTVRF